jgi:hypothetical protein
LSPHGYRPMGRHMSAAYQRHALIVSGEIW